MRSCHIRSVPGHLWRSLTLILGPLSATVCKDKQPRSQPWNCYLYRKLQVHCHGFPGCCRISLEIFQRILRPHLRHILERNCMPLVTDLRTSAMAGLEQLEIHSKVCKTCILVAHSLIHTVIHCSLGEGRRRSYNILEHSTA